MKQLRYVRKGYVNDDGGTKRKFSHQSTNKKLSGERRFCHELAKRALLRSLHPLPSCVEVGTAPVWQRVQVFSMPRRDGTVHTDGLPQSMLA